MKPLHIIARSCAHVGREIARFTSARANVITASMWNFKIPVARDRLWPETETIAA